MLALLPLQDSSGLHQAPCVWLAASSPFPGPQPRTQALQTGQGHGWGWLSPALGCSVASQPSLLPPSCGTQVGRSLGLSRSLPVPAPSPG